MPLQLTQDDLLLLDQQRLERFRACFSESLSFCYLQLDPHNDLKIHCAEPWLVDLLLLDLDELCWEAWVIVGASQVSIYYAQEEIYSVATDAQEAELASDFPVAS